MSMPLCTWYHAGVSVDACRALREAWKFLLGVYKPGSTSAERQALMRSRQERYLALRQQWQSITAEQAGKNSKWRERKTRVDKDVRRTDRWGSCVVMGRGWRFGEGGCWAAGVVLVCCCWAAGVVLVCCCWAAECVNMWGGVGDRGGCGAVLLLSS
jgi:hypothetical protein